jgi:hypothetical protein
MLMAKQLVGVNIIDFGGRGLPSMRFGDPLMGFLDARKCTRCARYAFFVLLSCPQATLGNDAKQKMPSTLKVEDIFLAESEGFEPPDL